MDNIATLNTSLLFDSNMGGEIAQIIGQLDSLTIKAGQVSASLKGIDTPTLDPIKAPEVEIPEIEIPTPDPEPTLKFFKGLALKIGGIMGSIKGGQMLVSISDDLTLMNARINSIITDSETLGGVQQAAFESSKRARADYLQTLDSIGKLGNMAGDAFSGTDEIIQFTEQLNKHFVTSGASIEGQASAMYQLNQAMAMGVLRGEEFNAIRENAPSVVMAIADYLNVTKGEVKELADEGKLSADIVKNSLFAAAEETNAKFAEIPMTFEQIKQAAKNDFIMELQPALEQINEFFNSDIFQNFVGFASAGLGQVASIVAWLVENTITGFTKIAEAIDIIGGPLLGLITIFGIYQGVVMAKAAAEAISAFHSSIMADGLLKATAAQLGLNTAILTSPIFFIPALLIGIIAIIFGVVTAINHVQGTTISALGVITGGINVAISFIKNIFKGLWNFLIEMLEAIMNGFISLAEFIANIFINPISAVKKLFYDLATFVLEVLSGITRAIDAVFGSNLTDSVNNWIGGLRNASVEVSGELVNLDRADLSMLVAERDNYGEAYNSGYEWGANAQSNISNLINSALPNLEGINIDQNNLGLPEGFDPSAAPDLSGIGGAKDDLKDLNKTTKSIDKAVNGEIEFKNEDLTYLREAATARAIQNFSFDKVVVQVQNDFGDVHQNADIDGWLDGINAGLNEAIETIGTTAGGVPA